MTSLQIATLVTNIFTYLCYASGLFVLSDKKDGVIVSIIRLFVFWLFMMALCIFAVFNKWRNFYWVINYIEIAAMLIVFSLDSNGCFAKKLFLTTAYITWFFITVIPCEFLLEHLSQPLGYILYAPTRIALYIIILIFWLKKGRAAFEKATEQITSGRWALLCVFSVTAILCVDFTLTRLLMLNTQDRAWDFAISASILLTVISAYVIIINIMGFLNEENEIRIIREREELLRNELEAEQKFIESSRQNRHDLRHHNRLLLDFLDKGDLAGLRAYLAEYDLSLDKNSSDFFCDNIVSNAMIRRAKDYAEKLGFGFSCEAQIPSELPLSNTETCVLLGNLLENALVSCKMCKAESKPYVNIRAKIRHQKLYLSVQNSVEGKVIFKDGLPKSTKQSGGVGIRSVLTTLQSHEGMASFAQFGSEFITQVILPL